MSSEQPAAVAPGLKAIPNADGSLRHYWRPNPEALALDYPQKTVRLGSYGKWLNLLEDVTK